MGDSVKTDVDTHKSSAEILSELFSAFNTKPPKLDRNSEEKSHKKHKKSKKKHKHKDKKRKKKSKHKRSSPESYSSSDTESEKEIVKYKQRKDYKQLNLDLDSILINRIIKNEPEIKDEETDIKKEPEFEEEKTVIKKEPRNIAYNLIDINTLQTEIVNKIKQKQDESSKQETTEVKYDESADDDGESYKNQETEKEEEIDTVKETAEKPNKIIIKDLKNSVVYENTVKEVEEKAKELSARIEDGEITESDASSKSDEILNDHILDEPAPCSKKDSNKYERKRKRSGRSREDSKKTKRDKSERKERHHHRHSTRSRGKDKYSYRGSKDNYYYTKSSYHRNYSDDYDKYKYKYDKKRSKSRDRSYSRDRSRSKDRWEKKHRSSSPSSTAIDKKRLLEIARKNAINMLKSGTLPDALTLGPQAQEKVIAAIKAGGKTIEELTDFCKNLSKKEALGELSSVSTGEDDGDTDSDGGIEKAFHHPFQIKDKPTSIVMNIKNATPLPIKTSKEKSAELRMQFPVSSGQLHRKSENEWVPVISKAETSLPIPVPVPNTQNALVPTPVPPVMSSIGSLLGPSVGSSMGPSAGSSASPSAGSSIVPSPGTSTGLSIGLSIRSSLSPSVGPSMVPPVVPTMVPPVVLPAVPTMVPPVASTIATSTVSTITPSPVAPPTHQTINVPVATEIDIGTIVSQRLSAIRKLQENPNDPQALNLMQRAQKDMEYWAQSKQQPGQFTGSTGAHILSAAELSAGYQAWARKDQLQTATPVMGGMGMHLLQKMGWKPGEGLGKEKSGQLEPLLLEVKLDKKGLVSTDETKLKKTMKPQRPGPTKNLAGKHPVSLLGELATKKKLGIPQYEVCFECGPDHKKNFLVKVILNGVEYKPNVVSSTKKQAKADAASIALQQLGVVIPNT